MTNIPWKQHFKTIIQRFLGIFNPDFFSYNQVDWGVIWYVHKYQIKLKNQKLLVHACATIWEASAVFKRCLTVSPDDQEFLFFHVIGIIVASSSCWEGRGKNDRALCRRWYFFFRSFLFPLLEIHMGHSKVQRCPLIYWDFNFDSYSFNF